MSEFQFFPLIDRIIEALKSKNSISIFGFYGSAFSLFIWELSRRITPIFYITNKKNIERYGDEITELECSTNIINENNPFFESAKVILIDEDFLERKIGVKENVELIKGETIDLQELLLRLAASGLDREEIVEEEGEYAIRGGVIDVYPKGAEPVRIELDGDLVYSIRKFDPQTQRSIEVINRYTVSLAVPDSFWTVKSIPPNSGLIIAEKKLNLNLPEIIISPEADFCFRLSLPRKYFGDLGALKHDINHSSYNYKFLLKSIIAERLNKVIGFIETFYLPLKEGFVDEKRKIIFLTESEIFGTLPQKKVGYKGLFIDDLKGLKIDDYVVHSDYGIGQFKGLTLLEIDGKKVECLRIDYAEGDKVYLPVNKINRLERYIGATEHKPRLSRLGSDFWLRTKNRVKKAAERIAIELLNIYAVRKNTPGFAFSSDSMEMAELEASFPYEETEDQLKAIEDVKRDMESPFPQDRLICGDVGFGKTEIALRAAFKAALDGKQTIFLCPTTLLAFQHYRTFKKRLENFPVRVEMVSRFKSVSELKEIIKEFNEGKVDIVIGTHRLLQFDVVPRDLGLLIVDEEQRFGVIQKERIKRLKPNIDVLYLSATPIPRTLYMALTGIKDISNIYTPPAGRKEIITKIIYFDEEEIKRAIEYEIARNGQVFFVHNSIQTIGKVRERLLNILPDLKICVIHGRMNERVSEERILEFIEGRYDLLLATAIVESGLDMPRVNTIIVDQAHRFGLSDLHQLRGRVGRSDVQAYAYFIVPRQRLTPEAEKRLAALTSYTSLGSGFRLALRDMEIRGIGNLLGKEQSGFVNAIGYHHYVKILNRAVSEIKGREIVEEPIISINLDAYFPSEYIQSSYERTALYKRLLEVDSEFELQKLKEEIVDRFGQYPEPVEGLFLLARLRLEAITIGATEIKQKGNEILFYHKGEVVKTIIMSGNTIIDR
ncbi:MAG: transcription-repair coupling factor [candidate division WOR-3 bacterium]